MPSGTHVGEWQAEVGRQQGEGGPPLITGDAPLCCLASCPSSVLLVGLDCGNATLPQLPLRPPLQLPLKSLPAPLLLLTASGDLHGAGSAAPAPLLLGPAWHGSPSMVCEISGG